MLFRLRSIALSMSADALSAEDLSPRRGGLGFGLRRVGTPMTAGINRQGRCDHQNEAGQRNLAHVEAGSISEEQRRQSGRSGFRTPTPAIAKAVATGAGGWPFGVKRANAPAQLVFTIRTAAPPAPADNRAGGAGVPWPIF